MPVATWWFQGNRRTLDGETAGPPLWLSLEEAQSFFYETQLSL
jgi:hypothetical protein